jgi:hypothetical protein
MNEEQESKDLLSTSSPSLCRDVVLRDCQDLVRYIDNRMRDALTWLSPNMNKFYHLTSPAHQLFLKVGNICLIRWTCQEHKSSIIRRSLRVQTLSQTMGDNFLFDLLMTSYQDISRIRCDPDQTRANFLLFTM